MKKTVLLLAVCLMLGLCACGLRGQSVARNAVEPVHFSAPAVRQDAAPAEEPAPAPKAERSATDEPSQSDEDEVRTMSLDDLLDDIHKM